MGVAIAIAVAAVVALCLWGLFRRGSISDRARTDPTIASTDREGQTPDDH